LDKQKKSGWPIFKKLNQTKEALKQKQDSAI